MNDSRAFAHLHSQGSEGNARIQTCNVKSRLSGKWRRKAQLVTAVDGSGISIYDLENLRIVSSHAIAPRLQFACPPCSVIVPSQNSGCTERRTYFALKGPKRRIQCFRESLGPRGSIDILPTWQHELKPDDPELAALEVLASSTDPDSALAIIFQDTSICALPGNLEGSPSYHAASGKANCLAAASISPVSAKEADDTLLIFQRTSHISGDQLEASYFNLSSSPSSLDDANHSKRLVNAGKAVIAELPASETDTLQVSFSPISSQLHVSHGSELSIHRLSGRTWSFQNRLNAAGAIASNLRLSSGLVATVQGQDLFIIDTRYGSVQGQIPQISPKASPPARLLALAPKRSALIALIGSDLIAFDLSSILATATQAAKGTGISLALCISKGYHAKTHSALARKQEGNAQSIGAVLSARDVNPGRKARKALAKAVQAHDEAAFDKAFEAMLQNFAQSSAKPALSISLFNSEAALSALSALFTLDETSNPASPGLRLEILPPISFKWLVDHNLLTGSAIERALRRTNKLASHCTLATSSWVQALAAVDPSLQTLVYLLAAEGLLMPSEVTVAMHCAITVMNRSHDLSKMKLLTDGKSLQEVESDDLANPSTKAFWGNQAVAGANHNAEQSPEPEPDADVMHDADALMHVCLLRMTRFHDSEVQKALSQILSHTDLLSLLDFLRAELAGGGWLSHVIEPHTMDVDSDSEASSDQMQSLARMLNCTLDALGAGAWLTALGQQPTELGAIPAYSAGVDGAAKLDDMKAEVAAALQGIEEAAQLEPILHEVLRYSRFAIKDSTSQLLGERSGATARASIEASSRSQTQAMTDLKKAQDMTDIDRGHTGMAMSKVRPATSLSAPVTLQYNEDPSLPPSLKPPEHLDIMRPQPGGGVKRRSAREIGQLKSRKVGIYSFERIVV